MVEEELIRVHAKTGEDFFYGELEYEDIRSIFKSDPLGYFLQHCDCDGIIPWRLCGAIANELEHVLPNLPDEPGSGHIEARGWYKGATEKMIFGFKEAFTKKENVIFG